jgi:AraC-like DNA-binding protein
VRDDTKTAHLYEPQLALREIVVPPGGEWLPQSEGWLVAHVSAGVGYWLHSRLNRELQEGTVLLLSNQIQGVVRASQVGELRLQYFQVEPGRLLGLASAADEQFLKEAAGSETLSMRVLSPDVRVSEVFQRLAAAESGTTFPARVGMLQLFLEVFGGGFPSACGEAPGALDARERLRQALRELPADRLMEMEFSELVSRTGCSARHVSRLFAELVGVPFRDKQIELRLARACELLATTDSKVADVALECGYQSTSLFNLTFRDRHGSSPARWRAQARQRKPARPVVRVLRAVA